MFSFRYADRPFEGNWRWPSPEQAKDLLNFICEMSRLTWSDILAQTTGGKERHKKHHDMPISGITKAAQARLGELRLDEIFEAEMFRFRLSGTQHLWGFRVAGVFYVIWWDPDHQVYRTSR